MVLSTPQQQSSQSLSPSSISLVGRLAAAAARMNILGLIKLEDAQRLRRKGFKKRAALDAVKVRFASDCGVMFPPRLKPLDGVFVEDTAGVFPDAVAVEVARALAMASSKGTLRTPTTEPPIVLRVSPSRQLLPALTLARNYPLDPSIIAAADSVSSDHSSGGDASPTLENLFLWGDCYASPSPSSNVSVSGSSWRTRRSTNSYSTAQHGWHSHGQGQKGGRRRAGGRGHRPGNGHGHGSPTSTIATTDNAIDIDDANADLYDDALEPVSQPELQLPPPSATLQTSYRASERGWDAGIGDGGGDGGDDTQLDPSATVLASFRLCVHERVPTDFFHDPMGPMDPTSSAPAPRLPQPAATQWYTLQCVRRPDSDPDRLTLRLLTSGRALEVKAERTVTVREAKMVIKKTTEIDPKSIDQIAIIEKFRCVFTSLALSLSRARSFLSLSLSPSGAPTPGRRPHPPRGPRSHHAGAPI